MLHTLTQTHTAVNIYAILTDGEHVYDGRAIHPDDLPALNERAQAETEGALWWTTVTPWPYSQTPDTRPLFEIATDAMTPLATLTIELGIFREYGSEQADAATMQAQVERLTQALKYIQARARPTDGRPVKSPPALYYQLGSGMYCDPHHKEAVFECLPHAIQFQEKYPGWRVCFSSPVTFELAEELGLQ